jgi:CRP-like cAMP-binding protein
MSVPEQPQNVPENRLLAALPQHVYESLLPHLSPVQLVTGQVLYEPFSPILYGYFLNNSLISCMSVTEQGASVAVGFVGKEGMIGAAPLIDASLLPYRVIVQIRGSAMRIPSNILKDWFTTHNTTFHRAILRFIYALFGQIVQIAVCNRFHLTEQRLARWLLFAHDRLDMDTLPITQEALAQMLGTDRASITRTARKLREAGLLNYGRGQVTIRDQERLELASCECYRIVKSGYDDMLRS